MKHTTVGDRIIRIFISFLLPLLCGSCEKVVSIDLNKANPQMVVEANVTDQAGPYTVFLSTSGNYFEPSLYFPPVDHALVMISDDLGARDTLRESISGTYRSSRIQGAPGRTYTLSVIAEGRICNAVSSMPAKVRIDSLYAIPRRESDGDKGYDLYVIFKDPPETANYYRFNFHVSEPLPPDSIDGRRYHLFSDKLTNGNEQVYRIRIRRYAVAGDTVGVDLQSIDKATYDYFRTLNDILTSDRSPTSLSPANPNTNLDNGSLGYFAAYAVDSKSIILR